MTASLFNRRRTPRSALALPCSTLAFLLLNFFGGGGGAEAQQVRVVSDETAVRLDPDAASPVITTLAAGTLVDWTGESGPFYTVSLPGETGQDNLVKYVLANEVEVVGLRVPTGVGPPDLTLRQEPSLDELYAQAQGKRSAGRKKLLLGAIVMGAAVAGVVIFPEKLDRDDYGETLEEYARAEDDYNRRQTIRKFLWAGSVVGSGLAIWGGVQWYQANQVMADIDLTRATTALAVPLSAPVAKVKTDLFVGVHPLPGPTGRRTAVGLQWTW